MSFNILYRWVKTVNYRFSPMVKSVQKISIHYFLQQDFSNTFELRGSPAGIYGFKGYTEKTFLYSSSFGNLDKLQSYIFFFFSWCGACFSCSRSQNDIPLGYRQRQTNLKLISLFIQRDKVKRNSPSNYLFCRHLGNNPKSIQNSHKVTNLSPASKSKPKAAT